MSLSAIAKQAGVSVSTVSKAFSGSSEIGESTRARVFEVARQMGLFEKYDQNRFPKRVIAVICPEFNSDYYNATVTLLGREIESRGGIMTVSEARFSNERMQELFSYYASYCKADGIIVIDPHGEVRNPTWTPAVCFGSSRTYEGVTCISSSLGHAIEEAVGHLKAMGHERIGFAGERLTTSKLNCFKNAMRKHLLPVRDQYIYIGNRRFEEGGLECAEQFLKSADRPTAILAAYDHIAIGIIKKLRKNGIAVPNDLSVIGMDDISVAQYLETALSSIRTHHDRVCMLAVDLLMKKIESPYYEPKEAVVVPCEFIPRESSGRAAKG